MGGAGVLAFGNGLRIAGDDEQPDRRVTGGHCRGEPAYLMEQLVSRPDVKRVDRGDRRIQDMVDAGQRLAERGRLHIAVPHIGETAQLGGQGGVADHQPPAGGRAAALGKGCRLPC